MSYPQFGYTYPSAAAAASSLTSSQLLVSGSTPTTSTTTSCCEGGRPIMTDPHTGQTVCSCQYSSSLLSYPRVAGLPESMYSSAYAAQGYMPFTADPSAFYSPLDNSDAWRSLAQPTPCYPYDPMTAGYAYGQSALAQRKNATREATSTLKAWLQEHIKNPYPTKGEKIMLAIITKMTLTQVSTWFANARRRLKKENKMTWSPRNRTDDDDRKLDSDDEDCDDVSKDNNNDKDGEDKKDDKDEDDEINIETTTVDDINVSDDDGSLLDPLSSRLTVDTDRSRPKTDPFSISRDLPARPEARLSGDVATTSFTNSCAQPLSAPSRSAHMGCMGVSPTKVDPAQGPNNTSSQKPRIWSLADVATSGNATSKDPLHPSGAPNNNNTGLGVSLQGPHPHPHPLSQQHLPHPHPHDHLSPTKPGDSSSLYSSSAVNGFRPWVNGSSSYPSQGGGQAGQGSLLRPYALAARAEVH